LVIELSKNSVVVNRVEYRIRIVGNDCFEVFRDGRSLGTFFGPRHGTPHRVVPPPDATVAEMRELYEVVAAWRELYTAERCAG
jgi:hypothetical protein